MTGNYEGQGIPLGAGLCKILIPEILATADNPLRRVTIIEEVLALHEQRGGLPSNSEDPNTAIQAAVKKALADLVEEGSIVVRRSGGKGSWGYYELPDSDHPAPSKSRREAKPKNKNHGSAYCVYLPTYKNVAESKGEDRWPCKIGKSDDPENRAKGIFPHGAPEKPVVVPIDAVGVSGDKIERHIHSTLDLIPGRRMYPRALDGSGQREWFLTSPDEAKAILEEALERWQ